jgi:glycosyltransferase involved in cell wall biosynthesis
MMKVAVVMPAYNAERYVGAAVESILGQTLGDFTFIIVNDGSKDGTADVLASFRDPRLKVLSQANSGICSALNAGLAAARAGGLKPADLIARMDADDISEPERLARQVEYMQKHQECVLLGTGVNMLCPAGLAIYRKFVPEDHETIARALWSGDSQSVIHPTVVMRSGPLEEIGGYQPKYCLAEDLDLYLRLLRHGRVANLPEPLLGYRQHPGSTNARSYDMQVRLMQQVIAEHDAFCPYQDLDRHLLNGWARLPHAHLYRRWAWNALKQRRLDIARQYAARCIRLEPFSKENWRLAYCTLRGS